MKPGDKKYSRKLKIMQISSRKNLTSLINTIQKSSKFYNSIKNLLKRTKCTMQCVQEPLKGANQMIVKS